MQQKYEIIFHYEQSLATISLNIFILNVNFDKSTIRLHFLSISFILAKFLDNQILITILIANVQISSLL